MNKIIPLIFIGTLAICKSQNNQNIRPEEITKQTQIKIDTLKFYPSLKDMEYVYPDYSSPK